MFNDMLMQQTLKGPFHSNYVSKLSTQIFIEKFKENSSEKKQKDSPHAADLLYLLFTSRDLRKTADPLLIGCFVRHKYASQTKN